MARIDELMAEYGQADKASVPVVPKPEPPKPELGSSPQGQILLQKLGGKKTIDELMAKYNEPPTISNMPPAQATITKPANTGSRIDELMAKYGQETTEQPLKPIVTPEPIQPSQQPFEAGSTLSVLRDRSNRINQEIQAKEAQYQQTQDPALANELSYLYNRRGVTEEAMKKQTDISGKQVSALEESRKAGLVAETAAPVMRAGMAAASGLSMGISDIAYKNIMRKAGLENYTQADSDVGKVAEQLLTLLGGVATGRAVSGKIGSLLQGGKMGGVGALIIQKTTPQILMATTRALSSIAAGDRNAKEALGDWTQNAGAAALNTLISYGVPAGDKLTKAVNISAQLVGDIAYDLATEGMRGRLTGFSAEEIKDYFVNGGGIVNLMGAVLGATTDALDPNFKGYDTLKASLRSQIETKIAEDIQAQKATTEPETVKPAEAEAEITKPAEVPTEEAIPPKGKIAEQIKQQQAMAEAKQIATTPEEQQIRQSSAREGIETVVDEAQQRMKLEDAEIANKAKTWAQEVSIKNIEDVELAKIFKEATDVRTKALLSNDPIEQDYWINESEHRWVAIYDEMVKRNLLPSEESLDQMQKGYKSGKEEIVDRILNKLLTPAEQIKQQQTERVQPEPTPKEVKARAPDAITAPPIWKEQVQQLAPIAQKTANDVLAMFEQDALTTPNKVNVEMRDTMITDRKGPPVAGSMYTGSGRMELVPYILKNGMMEPTYITKGKPIHEGIFDVVVHEAAHLYKGTDTKTGIHKSGFKATYEYLFPIMKKYWNSAATNAGHPEFVIGENIKPETQFYREDAVRRKPRIKEIMVFGHPMQPPPPGGDKKFVTVPIEKMPVTPTPSFAEIKSKRRLHDQYMWYDVLRNTQDPKQRGELLELAAKKIWYSASADYIKQQATGLPNEAEILKGLENNPRINPNLLPEDKVIRTPEQVEQLPDMLEKATQGEVKEIARANGIDDTGLKKVVKERIEKEMDASYKLSYDKPDKETSRLASQNSKSPDLSIRQADAPPVKKGSFEEEFIRNQRKINEAFRRDAKENGTIGEQFKRAFVDQEADAKAALERIAAKEAETDFILRKGVNAEADRVYTDAKKAIDEALYGKKWFYKDKGELQDLAMYIVAKRTPEATRIVAERGETLESPFSVEKSKEFADRMDADQSPRAKRIKQAYQQYRKTFNEQLTTLRDEGLISKEDYDYLIKQEFYSPRQFISYIDPETITPKGIRKFDSGIEALGKGSTEAMMTDPYYLLQQIVARTQSRKFKNRANKSLYNHVLKDPDNGIFRIADDVSKIGENEGVIKAYIDGQEKNIVTSKAIAEQYAGVDPILSKATTEVLSIISGSKVLKTLATGINPEFAIRNLSRDVLYAWFNSGQYNRVLPVASLQISKDFADIAIDAIFRKGRAIDYIKEGGGMEFLSGRTLKDAASGKLGKSSNPIKKVMETATDILGYLGKTSELLTRLAVRERAIKNGKTAKEATAIARNSLDFMQKGRLNTAIDSLYPYFNASIQGTRGLVRSFKTDPAGSTFKAAQLIALGLAYSYFSKNEEEYDSVSEEERTRKWIIPLGMAVEDALGRKRYAYLAIAKDQGQQIFTAIGQSLGDAMRGRPWDKRQIERLKASFRSLIDLPGIGNQIPIIDAMSTVINNYDSFRGRRVFENYGKEISPSKEFTSETPKLARDMTDLLSKAGIEISPSRISAGLGKLYPPSNPLVSGIPSIYEAIFTPKIAKTIVEQIKTIPFARDVLRFGMPVELSPEEKKAAKKHKIDTSGKSRQDIRLEVLEKEKNINDKRQILNVGLDDFMKQNPLNDTAVYKWIRENAPNADERSRLIQRMKDRKKKTSGATLGNSTSDMRLKLDFPKLPKLKMR